MCEITSPNMCEITSLTQEFAVLPFSYSEDIIVEFVSIEGICRPYHSDPP
jgi:hypothetical protein